MSIREKAIDIEAAVRLIGTLSDIFNTGDTFAEREAMNNVADGKPAFWTTMPYHNQAAGIFMLMANVNGLPAAVAWANNESRAHTTSLGKLPFLWTTLVPLNAAGRTAIQEQFA